MKTTTRKFNKNVSSFKDWQEDTPDILSQVIDHDSKLWKVERFVKEPADLPKIIETLKKYCLKLAFSFTFVILLMPKQYFTSGSPMFNPESLQII